MDNKFISYCILTNEINVYLFVGDTREKSTTMAFLSTPAAWRRESAFTRFPKSSRCTSRVWRTSTRMHVEDARADSARSFRNDMNVTNDPQLDLSEIEDGVVGVLGADYDLEQKRKTVRKRTRELLEEINRDVGEDEPRDADSLPKLEDDETMGWVRTVIRAGDERKAVDPLAVRVMRITYVTSFVVALSGRNEPQVRAIMNLVEENMSKEHGMEPKRIAGTAASGWILLDYGDMMVHIFTMEQRKFYNLEQLWKGGEKADISDCLSGASGEAEEEGDDESLDDWVS